MADGSMVLLPLTTARLLTYAIAPAEPRLQAVAASIVRSSRGEGDGVPPLLGLTRDVYEQLLATLFPRAQQDLADLAPSDADVAARAALTALEFADLAALLREALTEGTPEEVGLAHALAVGCLGSRHLWEDLALANRQALSGLFADSFPSLYRRNDKNMKWKKFLYRELCQRLGVFVCKSPSCAACSDYSHCFGPEEPGTRAM